YVTVSAGIIYGYRGKYKDKVPLNVGGFAPVVIPSVGYRLNDRFSLEVQFLGTAAFMVGTTVRF
ncbi:MAG: ABC transporter ATP-binding protein, partial [Gammaproteobacteria bacterium]|nr:ABC transporter ATP-binding protein [Gammaproteobacteria bacterium]NIU60528.1 ABC transporter ATP-binding protein [Stutzerimonas stutzeri]NIV19250.1 ABC transporter ATP-binding protein [Gammaproteobacteria bacterium]NIY30907.1 ABC transporter ATP-binding protein [Gammaproteobacteria bacterium]